MKSKIVKNDFANLNKFVKDLVGNKKVVKVGVLGNKNMRTGLASGKTNAEIGAKHEFGDPAHNIPIRSFLYFPIQYKMPELVKALKREDMMSAIKRGNISGALHILGIYCTQIIDEAFESDGFGMWEPLKPSTVAAKLRGTKFNLYQRKQLEAQVTQEHQSGIVSILIETSQLRHSITYKVDKP